MQVIFDKENFTISSTLRSKPKKDWVIFVKIKNKVMGEKYELSLNFIGKKRMRNLNRIHRDKDYATDVLSFPLDNATNLRGKKNKIGSEMGEVFMNLDVANKKSKDFDRTQENYLFFLFIHTLFHLKGMDHGSRMEKKEEEVRKFFNV